MKHLYLTLFCLIILLACNRSNKEVKDETCDKDKQELNPNGDSELAVLMRVMTTQSEYNAKQLQAGEAPGLYDDSIKVILTAKASDIGLDRELFNGFASTYLNAIAAYNKAQIADKVAKHNIVIQNCYSCHEQFCRGPLKRIDKMYVK